MGGSVVQELLQQILSHPILAVSAVAVLYLAGLATYRLFFHPLSKYPGPKIAAITVWYEFYYDAIQRGKYTFEIQRMHEKYGPVVRISPEEIHVNEPSFIDELYAGGGKRRDKYPYYSGQFGIPDSVFGTPGHDLHRLRRGALNRFFSKASVTQLEPIVHTAIEKLISQLRTHAGSGKPVALNDAFSCMTTDVVMEYAFAKSYDFLGSPSFQPNFHRAIIAGTDMGPWFKQFPWLIFLMNKLPESIVTRMNPEAAIYVRFQEDIRQQIRKTQDRIATDQMEEIKTTGPSRTIFHELLTGDLPAQEKRLERLWQEGQIVIGAGTETTAWGLSATIFYLLENPLLLAKLQSELAEAIPDPTQRVSWSTLEQLPYLSGVVSEGLRLSYGVSTRLQRINPVGPLRCTTRDPKTGRAVQWEFPAGTPVGMSASLIHMHPELFPDPTVFRPERWLGEKTGKKHHGLDGYLLAFSRGSRQCIGIK